MTAEQLEKLLAKVTQGDWRAVKWDGDEWPEKRWSVSTGEGCAVCVSPRYADHTDLTDATLISLAPSLARRVLAAEKLVEALRPVINSHWNESHIRGMHGLERALSTYEASK